MIALPFFHSLFYFLAFLVLEITLRHFNRNHGMKRSLFVFVFLSLIVLIYHGLYFSDWITLILEGAFFYFLWAYYMILMVNSENSFSLGVLQFIKKSNGQMIKEQEILPVFNIDSSISVRLKAMADSGFIQANSNGEYSLLPKGKYIALVCKLATQLLGIKDKG